MATQIELSLEARGYSVFRDRTSLPPGESYDGRIQAAIEESELFIFLINRESVSAGRYTLTELKFAEQKWQHPAGHVLPVLLEQMPTAAIPIYLRAVTILRPLGNVAAEVAAEAACMSASWWRRLLRLRYLAPAAALLLVLAVTWLELPYYLERREQEREAARLERESQSKADAGDDASAWQLLEQANTIAPGSSGVFEAQEKLAMKLLRYAGINYFQGDRSNFEKLVNQTLPVLARGTSKAKGERLSDIQAHMGWIEYLRERAGSYQAQPAQYYRKALEIDPGNVYGHAMWAFEILRRRGSAEALAGAKEHFAAAVKSRREREYLRLLQISALLQTYTNAWINDVEREKEAIRVANEMRLNGETRPKDWGFGSLKDKLWSIYHFDVVLADNRPAALLAALPAAEHLALFRWLFPGDDLRGSAEAPSSFHLLFVLALLQEEAGDRTGALASYRQVLSEFTKKGYNSSRAIKIADTANAAIKRLSN